MSAEVQFQTDSKGRKVANDVQIDSSVQLGNNVTIYPGVQIQPGASLLDNVVVGRAPTPSKSMNRKFVSDITPHTIIGENAIVGTGAVVYNGCQIGQDTFLGDHCSIREHCVVKQGVVIGRGAMLLDRCEIGEYTRIHDLVNLLSNMVIEEHVFIAAGVFMANDDNIFLSRFGLCELELQTPTIRKYAVIGSGVTLVPGVEIGMGSFVAAGAVVTKDVKPWTIASGVPAKYMKDIPKEWQEKVLEKFEGKIAE